jgi:Ca2+/H+ antiporter, TMEM165/GDT1 family
MRGRRRFWPFIPLIILAAIALFSFIVMLLWNNILVATLHVSAITFWQALGILVLSKILFGGFGPWRRHDHRGHYWRKEMIEKWKTMTPEEREQMKQQFRNRCWDMKRQERDEKTNAGIE